MGREKDELRQTIDVEASEYSVRSMGLLRLCSRGWGLSFGPHHLARIRAQWPQANDFSHNSVHAGAQPRAVIGWAPADGAVRASYRGDDGSCGDRAGQCFLHKASIGFRSHSKLKIGERIALTLEALAQGLNSCFVYYSNFWQ